MKLNNVKELPKDNVIQEDKLKSSGQRFKEIQVEIPQKDENDNDTAETGDCPKGENSKKKKKKAKLRPITR